MKRSVSMLFGLLVLACLSCGEGGDGAVGAAPEYDMVGCYENAAAMGFPLMKPGEGFDAVEASGTLYEGVASLCVPAGQGVRVVADTPTGDCPPDFALMVVRDGDWEMISFVETHPDGACPATDVVPGPGLFHVTYLPADVAGLNLRLEPVPCTASGGSTCHDGDVYAVNSCGGPGGLLETCGESELCVDGDCMACESAVERRCSGGDVYWFDSCGGQGDLAETCGWDEVCEGGACVPDEPYVPPCNTYCYCSCPCGSATIEALQGCLDSCTVECAETCDDMCYGGW